MDIYLTQRGQLIPVNGELPLMQDRGTQIAVYLNAALLSGFRQDLINLGKVHELRNSDALAAAELQIREGIINIIQTSPFAFDFDTSRLSVTLTQPTEDGKTTAHIRYTDEGEEISSKVELSFTADGGNILLTDPDLTLPNIEGEIKTLTEEYILEETTDRLVVAAEATQPVILLNSGEHLQTVTISRDLEDISVENRRTLRISSTSVFSDEVVLPEGGDGIEIEENDVAEIETTIEVDPEAVTSILGGPPERNTGRSTIFLSDILPEGVDPQSVAIVEDVKQNTISIDLVPSVNDYLIEYEPGDSEVELLVFYGTVVAKGFNTIIQRTNSIDKSFIPFPASDNQTQKLVFLDQPVEPGLYVLFYQGIGKEEYDASLWRT